MPNEQLWTYSGGKTTTICGLDAREIGYERWYARLLEFILRLEASPDFSVKDNGYRQYPGVVVVEGIKAVYRDKQFEIWSDVPGEIILRHHAMGHRLAQELVAKLGESWK
jgi:hypothetical protein